jgi:hypothetical protein
LPAEFYKSEVPAELVGALSGPFAKTSASVLATARKVGDAKLVDQVDFLILCRKVVEQCIEVKASSPSTIFVLELFLRTRAVYESLGATLQRSRVAGLFMPVSGSKATRNFHFDMLDGKIDTIALGEACQQNLESGLGLMADGLRERLGADAAIVNDGCPAGWLIQKDKLLSPESKEIFDALLSNKEYEAISKATDRLTSAIADVQKMMSAGSRDVIAADLYKDIKTTMVLGVETVAITYFCYKLLYVIALEKSLITRRKLIDDLVKAVTDKGVGLGVGLEAKVAKLKLKK